MTKDELITIIEKIREAYRTSDEVIPDYTNLEIENVLFCYDRVVSSGYYHSFEDKLANIIFNITKGHYLINGNKRVALILSFIFTFESEKQLFSPELIKKLIMKVASNELNKKELENVFKSKIKLWKLR